MFEINLNSTEAEYLLKIDFTLSKHDRVSSSCDNALILMKSLIERKAIPDARIKYLTNPEYNFGSRKSRIEVFESNGRKGDDIFKHPHFLKYLKYVVFGPDLNLEIKEGFKGLIESFGDFVSGEDYTQIKAFIKNAIRSENYSEKDRHIISEEFFKLAIECGLQPFEAYQIRDYAK